MEDAEAPSAVTTLAIAVVGPFLAGACLSWWAIGDLSEEGGSDVLVRAGWFEDHAALVGIVGLLVAVAVASRLAVAPRDRVALPAALSAGAGVLTGAALRVPTARTAGANIGGGIVTILGPPVLVVVLALAIRLVVVDRHRAPVR